MKTSCNIYGFTLVYIARVSLSKHYTYAFLN